MKKTSLSPRERVRLALAHQETDRAPIAMVCSGINPVALKTNYGDRLCFEGGVSVQKTLPFGTPEEVKKEVIERLRVLGKNGGYSLGPSHAIQDGTPPENIVAMFDTASGGLPNI